MKFFLIALIVPAYGWYSIASYEMPQIGCAEDSCPPEVLKWADKGKPHEWFYAKYPRDTKRYMTAYCNQVIGTEFECK